MKIAIAGGSGFVGRSIIKALQSEGHQSIVLSRHPSSLGEIETRAVDYANIEQLSANLSDCDVLINLLGILHETSEATFNQVHFGATVNLLNAAQQASISNYLHMSALGVDESGPSQYLISKAKAEKWAFHFCAQHQINMVSFRPSVIFGEEDNFFNQFSRFLVLPIFPVVCAQAQFQPVYVNDVAQAFVQALNQPINHRALDIVGPEQMTLFSIVTRLKEAENRHTLLIPLGNSLSGIMAKVMGKLPKSPMTYDNFLSMQKPNISNNEGLSALGITPTSIESYLFENRNTKDEPV